MSNNMSNLERAVEEAKHYMAMGVDTFSVRVGGIEIRGEKNEEEDGELWESITGSGS